MKLDNAYFKFVPNFMSKISDGSRLATTLVETQQLFHCGSVCVFFVVVVCLFSCFDSGFYGKCRGEV